MNRKALQVALSKPLTESDDIVHDGVFDPWEDILSGIHGFYSSESDDLMISAMEAVRDRSTFDFIEERGFAGEFALYVLSGHGMLDCGVSPRGGWPDSSIADLWGDLIAKWQDYAVTQWGGDFREQG